MRISNLLLLVLFLAACQASPQRPASLQYEPSPQHPFGRANPDAPPELAQFDFLVGMNDCVEQRINNATGEWVEGVRSWDAHYYMNGFAIRDSGMSGAITNSNIRVYDTASGEWAVTFFSTPAYSSGTWRGNMEDGNMVLRQAQKAPGTDFDGFSTLTFSNVSDRGFDWSGEWVSEDGSVVFPFWRIQCRKAARA